MAGAIPADSTSLGLGFRTREGVNLVPAVSLSHQSKQKPDAFRAGHLAGRAPGQGKFSYLSGLARRQVKKQSRLKVSTRRRRLRTAVRTTSRVGDRRAILGRGLHGTPPHPVHTWSH